MAKYLTNTTDLTAVANAIRTKGGTSAQLTFPSGFVSAIENIPSGGGIQGGYNITFNDGTDDIAIVSVEAGGTINSNPIIATKTGYVFKGWSTTSGGTTAISFPYTPAADLTVYAIFGAEYKCTVSNLGSSSPSSVTFNKDAGFTPANLGIEEVTKGTDVFIKIPTMYRKVEATSSGQITSFTIANSKRDNSYEPYSCFVDENGAVLEYILIGKYWNTSSSGCVSTTAASAAGVTVGTGRSYAMAKGTGYQLFDWQMQKLWQDLIICFKMTVNTNTGTAWTYDEMGIYWTTSYGWIDGVMGSSGTWKLCTAPTKYASLGSESDPVPADYVSAGYSQPTANGQEISKLGYDADYPFFNFPTATVSNSSYNTYYCDGYYYASGNRPVDSLVGCAGAVGGAFFCRAVSGWSPTGVRLCYRPLSA